MIRKKHFSSQENDGILLFFDQIKVSRLTLQIGHCLEGHFKLHLQPKEYGI